MTEEKLNELRQQDTNLRDAIWQDETERPQMPADLNERLMQRMAVEGEKATSHHLALDCCRLCGRRVDDMADTTQRGTNGCRCREQA